MWLPQKTRLTAQWFLLAYGLVTARRLIDGSALGLDLPHAELLDLETDRH